MGVGIMIEGDYHMPALLDRQIELLPAQQSLDAFEAILIPEAVHARLSAKCNLDCEFCERESWKRGDKEVEPDMSLEVWEALRDKFLPYVLGMEVCGLGEPTLARLFPQAASDVVDRGKILYFPTNGLFLGTKRVLDNVGEHPRVSVSVDAWDRDSYLRVRGGDWERLMSSVRVFRHEKPDAFLHSQYTAAQYNIDGLPEFVRLAADLGFNEVLMRFVQCHTIAREDVSLRYAEDRTERAIEAAMAIAEGAGIAFAAERRPYADRTLQSLPVNPIERLRRYLDFIPFAGGGSCATTTTKPACSPPVSQEAVGAPSPVIIRTRRVPRTTPEVMPTAFTPAALIGAANGDLWTCFAKHSVGDALEDDMPTVLARPRYQEFLHNRLSEQGALEDPRCRDCARVF